MKKQVPKEILQDLVRLAELYEQLSEYPIVGERLHDAIKDIDERLRAANYDVAMLHDAVRQDLDAAIASAVSDGSLCPPPDFWAHRVQHAVGQGSFQTTVIEASGSEVTIAYDCGSRNTEQLRRVVDGFLMTNSPPSILVLSHLDSDHVNGVEWLLSAGTCDAVFLPYVTPRARLVLLALEMSRNRVATWSDVRRTLNPSGWLRERGVRTIVSVIDAGDTGARAELEMRDDRPPDPNFRHEFQTCSITGTRRVSNTDCDAVVISGGPVTASIAGAPTWELRFFARPVRPADVDRLWSAIGGLIQPGHPTGADLEKALAREWWRPAFRESLVDAYRCTIGRKPNELSLCLLSEPCAETVQWHAYERSKSNRLAWLGTGDLPLKARRRLDELWTDLGPRMKEVGVFVVPHHGSAANFSADALKALSLSDLRPHVWVASAGRSKHHPSQALMSSLARLGGRSVHVGAHGSSYSQSIFGWHRSRPVRPQEDVAQATWVV